MEKYVLSWILGVPLVMLIVLTVIAYQ